MSRFLSVRRPRPGSSFPSDEDSSPSLAFTINTDEKTPSSLIISKSPGKVIPSPSSYSSHPPIDLPLDECQRFRASLEEANEKLELLGLLTSDNLRKKKETPNESTNSSNGQSSGNSRSKDIFHLIRKEKELENQFEGLQSKRNTLRGLSNKTKYIQNQGELKSLTRDIKDSIGVIGVNLKDHPTLIGNLQRIQRERAWLTMIINKTIEELKSGYYTSLISLVNQKSAEQRLLGETRHRTEKTNQAVKSLEKEMEVEWEEFERNNEVKQQQINELTAELKHLKRVSSLTQKFEQQTAIAAAESLARQRAERIETLKSLLQEAKSLQKIDKRVNKRTTQYLTKQKESMDQLFEQWEKKYNEDYGSITKDYEGLNEARTNAQLVLVERQQRWEADKAEKIALIEEAKKREADVEAKRQWEEASYLAACKIQFHWRVFWRRRKKELKKLKKKYQAQLRAQRKNEGTPASAPRSNLASPSAAASGSRAESRGISQPGSQLNSP
jgi:hypothetical protein